MKLKTHHGDAGHEKKSKNIKIRKIGINKINDMRVQLPEKIDFFSRPRRTLSSDNFSSKAFLCVLGASAVNPVFRVLVAALPRCTLRAFVVMFSLLAVAR
jgi:hypothetical protein